MPDKEKVKLKYTVPKTVGAAIDLLQKVRAKRQGLTALAKLEKSQESLLHKTILDMFKKTELDGAKGKLATASIQRTDEPTIKNWKAFETYLLKTKDTDLLQRRLSGEACRARWADGKKIPGVEPFTVVKIGLSKRKK